MVQEILRPPRAEGGIRGYIAGVLVTVALAGVAGAVFGRANLADVVMVLLLGIVITSLWFGYGPSLLAAALSVLCFDFFFIRPYFSFAVSDLRHFGTFAVMFLVAVVISELQRRFRDAYAAQAAMAIERAQMAEEMQRARVEAEAERLRSSLLSSVSHDLRTPLSVMKGAAGALLEDNPMLDAAARRELLLSIEEGADRLNRLIRNLLDMTRIESGALRVKKEWQPLEEAVGAALGRMDERLARRDVKVDLPDDLPLVPVDGLLLEQALINLLENAAKYSDEAAPIEIAARAGEGTREVIVEVRDRGRGLPPGDRSRLFEKFYRGSSHGEVGGVGLGLAICRGVVEAHGGRIEAEDRPGGGAIFRFTIPLGDGPPTLDLPELNAPAAVGDDPVGGAP